MPNKQLKVFGAFRTGSNLTRSLLELNYDVVVYNNQFGYKHIPVPADYRNSKYKPFPVKIVSTVKDPFAFLDSVFRYCKDRNFLNIEAGRTFDEFCYQPFIVFDSGFEGFPKYRFSNPVQYWNSIYYNLVSLPQDQNVILRYEDLLQDMEGEICAIGEKFNLSRKTGEFIEPTGVTKNLGDAKRSSAEDYFQSAAFERRNYYLEREYLEGFTGAQKDFIFSELDQNLLQSLKYPTGNLVRSTQGCRNSFISDSRQLDEEQTNLSSGLKLVQAKLENDNRELNSELRRSNEALHNARKSYKDIRDSFSYKFGYDLIHAVIRPGKNTLMLPFRVAKLLLNAFKLR